MRWGGGESSLERGKNKMFLSHSQGNPAALSAGKTGVLLVVRATGTKIKVQLYAEFI